MSRQRHAGRLGIAHGALASGPGGIGGPTLLNRPASLYQLDHPAMAPHFRSGRRITSPTSRTDPTGTSSFVLTDQPTLRVSPGRPDRTAFQDFGF